MAKDKRFDDWMVDAISSTVGSFTCQRGHGFKLCFNTQAGATLLRWCLAEGEVA